MARRGTDPDILRSMANEIRRKREITQSLSLASRRQKYMLPKDITVPGYDLAHVYLPCDAVSGDFYDIVPLEDGHEVAMFIGDVSGHGIEAALFMGMGKMAMGIFARQHRVPSEVLAHANDELAEDLDSETFITGLYALLDAQTGKLSVGRAGHPKPVIFNPRRSPKWSYVEAKGLVLGMAKGPVFRKSLAEAELVLAPGDLFFLYTDGLVEAHDEHNEAFGNDRMLEIIEKHGSRSPQEIIDALVREVEGFLSGKPLGDDVTLIALKRK
ncbi:MAG TPA: serine/threonine-protein phosphatase [Planctomycetes bacterium]|nr:serine/threonine-protein phosphatase [Planctomycetota bacterium]